MVIYKTMLILGIESTCDETSAAVVKGGRKVLTNVVASSVDLQQKYGGVVPEVAAREQVRVIVPVIKECLSTMANRLSIDDGRSAINEIDAIAVAHGPGLIGSLLIGVETAKALALAWDKPLIPVNHLVGHVYANWINKELESKRVRDLDTPIFPLVSLIVSGGHTDLVLMKDHGDFKLLGSTLDDAAGEAFDKVAKLLGLGYPGGPEIERAAQQLTIDTEQLTVKFPRPLINSKDFDFSFSGLKTAVVNRVNSSNYSSNDSEKSNDNNSSRVARTISDDFKASAAYEFQQAVVDVLVTKTIRAAKRHHVQSIVVGGGVAANNELRSELTINGSQLGFKVYFPSKEFSVDNGAMIAAAAFYNFKKVDPLKLSADPSLHF